MNKKITRRLVGATIGLASLAGVAGAASAVGEEIWVVDTGLNRCQVVGHYEHVASIPSGSTVSILKASSTGPCLLGTVTYKPITGSPLSSDILYEGVTTTGEHLYLRLRG